MTFSKLAWLLTGTALLVPGIVAEQAYAQTVSQAGGNATAPSAAADEGEGLTDIVVTAQRRLEKAQSVPISITSVSGEQFQKTGYIGLTDLQYVVPGVQYNPTQGAAFQIRGVGSSSFDLSNAKSVNVVVDDVVMDNQRDNGLIGLVDIARVDPEALRAKYTDPLVFTGAIRVRTGYEILRLTSYLQQHLHRITVPVLVMHGADDMVTDPEGSRALYERSSSADKSLRLYGGLLHDLLIEPEKEAVMDDIVAWLRPRV